MAPSGKHGSEQNTDSCAKYANEPAPPECKCNQNFVVIPASLSNSWSADMQIGRVGGIHANEAALNHPNGQMKLLFPNLDAGISFACSPSFHRNYPATDTRFSTPPKTHGKIPNQSNPIQLKRKADEAFGIIPIDNWSYFHLPVTDCLMAHADLNGGGGRGGGGGGGGGGSCRSKATITEWWCSVPVASENRRWYCASSKEPSASPTSPPLKTLTDR